MGLKPRCSKRVSFVEKHIGQGDTAWTHEKKPRLWTSSPQSHLRNKHTADHPNCEPAYEALAASSDLQSASSCRRFGCLPSNMFLADQARTSSMGNKLQYPLQPQLHTSDLRIQKSRCRRPVNTKYANTPRTSSARVYATASRYMQ